MPSLSRRKMTRKSGHTVRITRDEEDLNETNMPTKKLKQWNNFEKSQS